VKQLPEWKTTPYTPKQMRSHGVEHSSIVWAFLRPEVLGDHFGPAVCDIAARTLPFFEKECPNDDRPRKAIAAARKCFADPSPENRKAAARAVRAARAAQAARAAWTARAAAWAAADQEAEELAQIEIIEAALKGTDQ
jgi:hypothetical protein